MKRCASDIEFLRRMDEHELYAAVIKVGRKFYNGDGDECSAVVRRLRDAGFVRVQGNVVCLTEAGLKASEYPKSPRPTNSSPMAVSQVQHLTPSQIRELFSDRQQDDIRRGLNQDEWNDMMRHEREYSKLRGNSLYDWMMKRKAPSMDHKSH